MKRWGKGTVANISGKGLRISRRQMLHSASLATMFATLGGAGGARAASALWQGAPVVSFHRDEPWIDSTGLAPPYRPASGCRGGAAASSLGEEALHRLNCYL